MGGFGEMHDDERDGSGQTGREPLVAWERIVIEIELEDSRNDDTNETAEKVSKYE